MKVSAKPSPTTERSELLREFIEAQGLSKAARTPLPADASRRTYTRLSQSGRTYMLMDAPPPEDTKPFVHVATYLKSLGFSAPQILAQDPLNGFLLMEDFGDDTFTALLNKGEEMTPLYDLAVDTLISLHGKAPSLELPPFTVEMLVREARALVDSYLPVVGVNLSDGAKADYEERWRDVFTLALEGPKSLVLRDYHVDNLMRLPNRSGIEACGLLDFQDAVWGPVVFDLVSLVEDARLDLPAPLVSRCWDRYTQAFPQWDPSVLQRDGCILSAGRHAKIIGYFTRFVYEDGKPKYLQHIPRVIGLLHQCLNHSTMSHVKSWFDEHVTSWETPHK